MIEVSVPATTTNFGSGFDAFGLALNLRNAFIVVPAERYSVKVEGYGEGIPTDESNLFVKVYKRTCEYLGVSEKPFGLLQRNSVPPARGLGSSATAIAGAIETALALHGKTLPLEEKLKIAFEFESHPDNLLPAFVGGFTLCATEGGELVNYAKLPFPRELKLLFFVPSYCLSTEEARRALPKSVPLPDAVFNLQRSALLVASLLTRNYSLLKEALRDRLHQPYREKLVPGFREAVEEAYRLGATGAFLSGAGPTLCVLSLGRKEELVKGVKEVLEGASGGKVEVLELEAEERGVIVSPSPSRGSAL